MRQYQTLLTLAAVVAATALSGCASRQPASTSVVVVPQNQSTQTAQAAISAIRSGTVVAVYDMNAVSSSGQSVRSSGGTVASGASSSGQIVTVQFDDGQRQVFDVATTASQQFQVGERVTVNTTQGTAVIAR